MMKIFPTLILVIGLTAIGHVQDAGPKLPETDALKIRVYELTLENLVMKQRAIEIEARTFIQTLQKEGFELRREADGKWIYIPNQTTP